MTDNAQLGPIEIRVPPDPSLSKVLRLAASGLATLGGFSVDRIEDIKIGISEVLIALIEHGAGAPVEVKLSADEHSFTILGATAVAHFDTEHPDLVLCRTVLAGASTSHGIDLVGDQAHIWAVVSQSAPE